MRRTSLLLCTVLVFVYTQSLAQSVDLLTGRLQMSFPIGQLQANDISIPITVYNHGMSLMVAEGEGDCGMGWGVNANNFSVSRVVRGLHDEVNTTERKGWLHNNNAQTVQGFTPAADDNLSACGDEVSDWTFLNNLTGTYQNDTEPDLFTINAPGLSAQFVFGVDGTPRLLGHQDITIQYYVDSIIVKNNSGIVYKFKTQETVYRRGFINDSTSAVMNTDCRYYKVGYTNINWPYDANNEIGVSWKLTSITSMATGTSALFTYAVTDIQASKRYYNIDSTNYVRDVIYGTYNIASISLKSYTATFAWSNKLLQKITIEESNTLDKKEVQFEYKGSVQWHHPSYSHVTKNFLKGLRMIGGQCMPYESYSFRYQDEGSLNLDSGFQTHINWKKNWGQDYFGYFNAESSNKNLPALYLYTSEPASRRLRVNSLVGFTPTQSIAGHNRTPSANNSLGALKKITYPTGGYTEIEWEPNRYKDNSSNEEFIGGGARVKKISSYGGEVAFGKTIDEVNPFRAVTKEYEYLQPGTSTSSGIILAPVKLGYITTTGVKQMAYNLGDPPMILYSHVKEKVSGQGSTLYQFDISGVYPEVTSAEWKATKSRIARQSGCSFGHVVNASYQFPYAPASNYDFRRGQLQKVTEYNESGVSIREKIYTYSPRTQNASIIKGIRFEKINNIYYYGIYEVLTGRMEVVSQEVAKEASHEDPNKWFQTTTTYAYNANHMLETVTATHPDNSVTTKRFKYARDFPFGSPVATDTAAVALKALNDTYRGSEIVEQISKVTLPGSPETVSHAELITYRNFGNNRVLPYFIKTLPVGASLTESTMSGQNFSADTDYRMTTAFREYDNEGRLLTEVDNKKNYLAHHYALAPAIPVATFYNAKAQQVIYEGFEMTTSFGLTANGSDFQYPAGWTGEKAVQFRSSSSTLGSSSANLIQKNGNSYRVSCWIYSIQNKTITFNAKSGASTVGTITLTNPLDNKWNYLEGEMNLSGAGSTFTLEVITNATIVQPISVDDIVFIPVHARVSLQTALPMKGITSATDDRGNSVKNTYDMMGRVVNTLDRNRNLVQKNEYSVKNMTSPKPHPYFLASTNQYFINTPITFTPGAPAQCEANVTYVWEVDGVGATTSPGNILIHTFTTTGQHHIKLTATAPSGASSSFSQTICVEYQFTGTLSVLVTDSNGNPASTTMDCNSTNRYINVTGLSSAPGCTGSVGWTRNGEYYGTGEIVVSGMAVSGTEPIVWYLEASVVMDCASFKDCTFSAPVGYSGTAGVSITFMLNPNCN